MIFICTFVSAIYLYRIIFGGINKLTLVIISVVGLLVFILLTEARNYYNYHGTLSGIDYYLHSIKSLLNAYLGGVTNVGVAINTVEAYGSNATFSSLIIDLLRPIVGLNKILPVRDGVLSNSYFNYVFFGNDAVISQIMPMIGNGYYYFGNVFAPLGNIGVLFILALLERARSNTMRIELVYIFMTFTMRLSMMMGINLIIVNNECSMQVLLPLLIYWLNNKVVVKISH